MNVEMIKKQLHEYIEEADEKNIKDLFMLVEDEMHDQKKILRTKEQLALLNEEREMHLKGKTKSYNWVEARRIIQGKGSL